MIFEQKERFTDSSTAPIFENEGEAFLFVLYSCVHAIPTMRTFEMKDVHMVVKKKSIITDSEIDTTEYFKKFLQLRKRYGVHEPTRKAVLYMSNDTKVAVLICCLEFTKRYAFNVEPRVYFVEFLKSVIDLDYRVIDFVSDMIDVKYK